MEYKGVKIYNELILVEKLNDKKDTSVINQAYVVDLNNKKMLETAERWAEKYIYEYDSEGQALLDDKGHIKYHMSPGIQHRYKNGTFKFEICDSASSSSQGGKLSFWNCKITSTEDNKEYMIGINSELLLSLLKSNTFVNGICESLVWLGRVQGNQVGAFTQNMELFAQSKVDEEFRQIKTTTDYIVGQRVISKTTDMVYAGSAVRKFRIFDSHRSNYSYDPYIILVYSDKPITEHFYIQKNYCRLEEDPNYYFDDEGNITFNEYYKFNKVEKKSSKIVTDTIYKMKPLMDLIEHSVYLEHLDNKSPNKSLYDLFMMQYCDKDDFKVLSKEELENIKTIYNREQQGHSAHRYYIKAIMSETEYKLNYNN